MYRERKANTIVFNSTNSFSQIVSNEEYIVDCLQQLAQSIFSNVITYITSKLLSYVLIVFVSHTTVDVASHSSVENVYKYLFIQNNVSPQLFYTKSIAVLHIALKCNSLRTPFISSTQNNHLFVIHGSQ